MISAIRSEQADDFTPAGPQSDAVDRTGEIELPMKVVRLAPDVDVRAIREGQGFTREQFAERYGLQVRAIQEWEQGRRKPEPAVRAYMLVIKNQPDAVRKALTAA